MPMAKNIVVGALFGELVFISKVVLPIPIDKMLIFIEALLLTLGSFLIGGSGNLGYNDFTLKTA